MEAKEISEGAELHKNYRLVQLLGQGGMGQVWEAEHMRLPRRVAIKFLLGWGSDNAELVARFRREAEIASRLVHPNIVSVHDYNTLEDGTPYLVMDLLSGEDLRARIDRGKLNYNEAKNILLQIVSALDLAHDDGVVHRDLKPENVFLCREPDGTIRAKVLDFGISKLQDSNVQMTREDVVMGTPGYMAPEQAMGKNALVDRRTDLFSLAAIFYEMVTGENVFLGQTLAEVIYKVTQFDPEPLSHKSVAVPSSVSDAVAQALSKQQDRRQATVKAFAAAFSAQESMQQTVLAPSSDFVGPTSLAVGPMPSASAGSAPPTAQDDVTTSPAPHTPPSNQSPSDQAPFDQAPFDQAPFDQAPFDQAPFDQAPSDRAPLPAIATEPSAQLPDEPSAKAPLASHEGAHKRPGTPVWLVAGLILIVGGGAWALGARSNSAASDDVDKTTQAAGEEVATEASGEHATGTKEQDATVTSAPGTDQPAKEPSAKNTGRHPEPPAAASAPQAPAATSSGQTGPPRKPAPSPSPAPRASNEALTEAAAALSSGDASGALRLARKSLRESKTPQAYSIMAQAYCLSGDIGMANAMARNLGPASHKRVESYCKSRGIELTRP